MHRATFFSLAPLDVYAILDLYAFLDLLQGRRRRLILQLRRLRRPGGGRQYGARVTTPGFIIDGAMGGHRDLGRDLDVRAGSAGMAGTAKGKGLFPSQSGAGKSGWGKRIRPQKVQR